MKRDYKTIKITKEAFDALEEYCARTEYSEAWLASMAILDACEGNRAREWATTAIPKMKKSRKSHDLYLDLARDEIKLMERRPECMND